MLNQINFTPNKSHGTWRVPWLTVSLSLLMVGLYFLADQGFPVLLFNKTAIGQGEFWRFLTGHFVHCTFEHLFWDVLAFIILGSVIEMNDRRQLIQSLLVNCLGVSLWILLGTTQITTYCGLSGALSGMLVIAAILRFKQTGSKMYLWVIVATIGKVIFELSTHQTLFTNLSAQAVPGAHVSGLVVGVGYTLWSELKNVLFARRHPSVGRYN